MEIFNEILNGRMAWGTINTDFGNALKEFVLLTHMALLLVQVNYHVKSEITVHRHANTLCHFSLAWYVTLIVIYYA